MRRSPTSEDFYAAIEEIKALHDRKQSDYGRAEAPFANVEKSADFGIEPWVGALVRGNDKMGRLQKAAQGGTLSNEGVEDSLADMAVYALIALVEYRAMIEDTEYDPYQFDMTDEELAAEWLEKDRNFDGPPDQYYTPPAPIEDTNDWIMNRGEYSFNSMLARKERELAERVSSDFESSLYNDLDDACPPDCSCNGGEADLEDGLDDYEYGCKACLDMLGKGEDLAFINERHGLWLERMASQR